MHDSIDPNTTPNKTQNRSPACSPPARGRSSFSSRSGRRQIPNRGLSVPAAVTPACIACPGGWAASISWPLWGVWARSWRWCCGVGARLMREMQRCVQPSMLNSIATAPIRYNRHNPTPQKNKTAMGPRLGGGAHRPQRLFRRGPPDRGPGAGGGVYARDEHRYGFVCI